MKFRSPGKEPVYVCVLSGHSAVIGPEWRELPLALHAEALVKGCVTDNMADAVRAEREAAAVPEPSVIERLVAVVRAMMANPQQGDFTQDDLPNMKRVQSKVDFRFTKDDLMQAVYVIGRDDDAR